MPYKSSILIKILDSMNEGVLVINQNTLDMIECNSTLLTMLGLTESKAKIGKKDVIKRILATILNPEQFEKSLQTLKTSQDKKSIEELHFKTDQYLEWRAEPFDLDAETKGQIFFFRDVTAEKMARKKLLTQNALLESIITSIPYSIFWKDENLNYLGCNQSFAQDAGQASPMEIIGKSDYDMPWQGRSRLI